MATKYKAVNAAALPTPEGTLLYTVPSGRIAKLTFASCQNETAYLGVTPNGSETMIPGPRVDQLSYASGNTSTTTGARGAANCANMGVYFSSGDKLYACHASSSVIYGLFISLIEEYEEAE